MPTSPRPITWWTSQGRTPAFKQTFLDPIYVVGQDADSILRIIATPNEVLYIPIFEIHRASGGETLHSQIMKRLEATLTAVRGGPGWFYGLIQSHFTIRDGSEVGIETMNLGLALSEHELYPYSGEVVTNFPVWSVITHVECERIGLPVFALRPTRFEREDVI
mgnify:CR=1 FL=1